MKLIRNGLVVAAVSAALVVPATAAHAEPDVRLAVTGLGGAGSQGWLIDPPSHDLTFAAGPASIGSGSLQFAAKAAPADVDKIYIKHELDIRVRDYRRISFDYYLDPASSKRPEQYYLNVYVDVASISGSSFFDCVYDAVGTEASPGVWHTVGLSKTGQAARVRVGNGAVCGDQISDLNPADRIFRIAVNGGDLSATDNQIKGALDNVVVRTAGPNTITYDFEPAASAPSEDCSRSRTGLNPIVGTNGNDSRDGTPRDDRIELLRGNDSSDAGGGADCVLGGDGNDRLRGGAGADEIQGGPGNDMIDGDGGADVISGGTGNDQINGGAGRDDVDAGPGNDTVLVRDGQRDEVDCGGGNDTVIADAQDDVHNCERGA